MAVCANLQASQLCLLSDCLGEAILDCRDRPSLIIGNTAARRMKVNSSCLHSFLGTTQLMMTLLLLICRLAGLVGALNPRPYSPEPLMTVFPSSLCSSSYLIFLIEIQLAFTMILDLRFGHQRSHSETGFDLIFKLHYFGSLKRECTDTVQNSPVPNATALPITFSILHLSFFLIPCFKSNTSPISSQALKIVSISSFVWEALTQNLTRLVTSGVAG